MLRVGFVGIQPRESAIYAAFLERMAELSYEEGRNFTFEYIQAANVDAYEKSYLELAARKVDVFLAVGNEPALRAALSAAGGAHEHRECGRRPKASESAARSAGFPTARNTSTLRAASSR